MNFTTWTKILKNINPMMKKEYFVLGGGEPFLNPKLFEIINSIRKKHHINKQTYNLLFTERNPEKIYQLITKTKILITTNASILNKTKLKKLNSNKCVLWISLDAYNNSIFKKIRRNSNPEEIKKNIILAKEFVPIHINTVLNEINAKDICEILKFVNQNKIPMIRFAPVRMIKNAIRNNIKITCEHYIECIKKINNYYTQNKNQYTTVIISLPPTYQVYLTEKYPNFEKIKNIHLEPHICHFGELSRAIITPNGDLMGCCNAASIPFFKLGNLLETNLNICLNNKKLDKFENKSKECDNCKTLLVCNKGCRVTIYEKNHSIKGKDPTCISYKKRC